MIGIGIIGTGFAERVQMPALRHVEGARLVAVSSGHRANAERAAETFDIPTVCDSIDELVGLDAVDLVVVSSPPDTHEAASVGAARNGKHVLCEKPMAMDAREARRMVAATEEAGVLALVDHELRFNPNRRHAATLLADGYVGEVRHVTVHYRANFASRPHYWPFGWWHRTDTGGGMLGAIGSHVVDTIRWWAGEIAEVDCRLRTFVTQRPDAETGEPRRVESDDFASLRLGMTSGATAELSLSGVTMGPLEHRFEVVGSTGMLVLDDERLTLTGWRHDAREDLSQPDPARGLDGLINDLWAPSFVHLGRAVVEALEAGERTVSGAATFRDGLATQEVLDAARRSDAQGERVPVPSAT